DTNWERFELRPLGDQPGAERAKDAHSDRYTLEWLKKAEGYEGAYGRATMTLDLVTGRPVGFTVNVLDFEPPSRVITRDEAMRHVRQRWIAEKDRFQSAGYMGAAERYFGWPEPPNPEATLVLMIRDDGSACFGSTYGERLASEGKARLCWVFGHGGTEIAIDAENGEPFAGGISKSSIDAERANPTRDPYVVPPGVMQNPLIHGPLPSAAAGVAGLVAGWWLRARLTRKGK
ncbi:MAG: hypothetical protein IT207_01950, partial [Fimbriimonadaceae bacterium]|nr:hypothetical protein [Fimbriimonadaceae bacterium]